MARYSARGETPRQSACGGRVEQRHPRRGGGTQRGAPWWRRRMAIALGELGCELAGEDVGIELDLWVGACMRARGRVSAGGMASGAWSMGEGGLTVGGARPRAVGRLDRGGGSRGQGKNERERRR
jgi:hypothetical protein